MVIEANSLSHPEPERFQIRQSRPRWFYLAVAIIGTLYAAGYACFFRSGPTYEIGGIKCSLDIERALLRAKLSNRPVLLYFTAMNSVNNRKLERDVLLAPMAVSRLQQYECAAVFTDQVPIVDEQAGKRLGGENRKLQKRLLGDNALPAFAVVDPAFDPANPSRYHLHSASIGMLSAADLELFLGSALAKWKDTRRFTAVVTAAVFHPLAVIFVGCCGAATALLWFVEKINQINNSHHAGRPRGAPWYSRQLSRVG